MLLIGVLVQVRAAQLSGTFTIDATQPASTTNFQNFNSAITYLTSANQRSDGGPANSAPFGVNGPVVFNVVSNTGPYVEQVIFPNITGASPVNTITFNGNGNFIQDTCTTSNYSVIRFNNGDHYRISNFTIKPIADVNYGWGIHFYLGSDSNVVENCTIDISFQTSTSSVNTAGIVFSGSLTSPTSSGTNGYGNVIQNNLIKGNPTGAGMYYGIVGFPATSSTPLSANRFINNTIEDFYVYGVYWGNSYRSIFRGNTIRRPNKTTVTTAYGFYLTSGCKGDTFNNNRIVNLFGGVITSTSTAYGIYAINYSGTAAEPNVFYNNLIKMNNGDGSHYGIYLLTAFNNRFYHNTVSIENAASTSTTATTQGFYFTGTTSASSTLDFRNNIISITRTGTGPKQGIVLTTALTAGATIGKNGYFGNNASYVMGNYAGVNYTTYAQWKAAIGALDQTSSDFAPSFVAPASDNYSPQDAWYNGNGDPITGITTDITGATRTLPLDIGAYEATPINLDVAASRVILPATPYTAGTQAVSAEIRNGGSTVITSAVINWSINGVAQTPVNYSGSLAGGATSAPILLGNITTVANNFYTISFTVSSPNGGVDAFTSNNTAGGQTAPVLPGGTYTINAAGAGANNFTNFTTLANVMNLGGISGPIVVNVVPNSGPYNEQVTFNVINGASSTNRITFNGNGERVEFNNTNPSSIGVINLLGSDFFTFTNLGVRSLNATYGVGYLLSLGADSNVIENCTIDISSVTGGSGSAGIAVTAALNSPASSGTNVGRFNRFEGNTITGNASGGPYYGISVMAHNSSGGANNGYVIRNNTLRDFTLYGLYIMGTAGASIKGNTMSRPTKSSPSTFYGIYGQSAMAQDTIENNVITQPFEAAQTNTNTFYGMYFIATNVPTARPVIVRNNIISNVKSAGAVYGIYFLSATTFRLLHNTISIDHPTSTSTSATQLIYNSGAPNTLTIRNNILFMNRGGTGTKHLIYLATTATTGYVINNNDLCYKVPAGSTNNFTGYYTANQLNLTAWRTVNTNAFDQNSTDADPLFRTQNLAAPLTPGNDSLNNIGANVLTDVPVDFAGAARTTTPDPGAYEFVTSPSDAGLSRFTSPVNPISLGSSNVDLILRNFGTGALTSSSIDWEVNGSNQGSYSWTGSVNAGDSTTVSVGSYNFTAPGFYNFRAWSSSPNGVTDILRYNDTITATYCTPLSGNFTIDKTIPASSTNFTSFSSLLGNLTTCGVSGVVNVAVAPGTYNEQVVIGNIPGLSAGNRINFIGADSATTKVVFAPGNTNLRYTLLITGADNLSFSNIRFENTGASFGTAVQIFGDATNRSDSITFTKCSFIVPVIANSAINPFVVSSSLTGPTTTTFQNATALVIDSCSASGGYYGISIVSSNTTRATGITVTNSFLTHSYLYATYFYGLENVSFQRNRIIATGRALGYTTPYGFYGSNLGQLLTINANTINSFLGGYGIYITTHVGSGLQRSVISNNMIQIGEQSNTANGIYLTLVGQTVVAHNSVSITSASSTASCLFLSSTNATTYNTVDVINNIFQNPLQGYVIYLNDGGGSVTSNILQPVVWKIDNNCYYGLATYPYRSNNFISANLPGYITATQIFNDSFSVTLNPAFLSATNLRTTSIPLNNIGKANVWVTTDIDGVVRGAQPDLGVNEFTPPANDAGVIGFVLPRAPQDTGFTDVRVLIRNFGAAAITGVDVSYVSGTTTHTKTYTGNLASNGVDTVTFDATSGPGATSQQFYYTGTSLTLMAYTASPNGGVDADMNNDTARLSLCRGLSGTYTINPAGAGANNFTSFTAAVSALNCGGVLGPVVFEVANGTYTEQVNFGVIPGASATNTIVFRSAALNRSAVTLTFAPTNTLVNHTVALNGTQYVYFEHLTLANTSTTFGRVVSMNIGGAVYASNISIRNCNVTGAVVTSTSDANALIYSATGTHVQNVTISNCNLTNGSMAVGMGGQNVINQYSNSLVIDSNNISNFYYYGLYLLSRASTKIRNNVITPSSTTAYYGIYMVGASSAMEVANNTVNMGSGYAFYLSGFNQYGEVLSGRIYNNAFIVNSSAVSGIYMTTCSNLKVYNNSINLVTTSTTVTQGGIYYSGSTAAAPQVAASQMYIYNNAINSATLPALSIGNAAAITAMVQNDYNVYFGTGTVLIYQNGTSIAPASFNNFKGAINGTNDLNSYYANPTFTSATNIAPLTNNSGCWVLNGRGLQEFGLTRDRVGNFRSDVVSTGAPDIGAFEFTPAIAPPAATVTGTIGYGNVQHYLAFGDTVATVTWGFSGTLPVVAIMRFAPGTLISNRSTSPNSNAMIDTAAHLLDAFWNLSQSGGSNFSYDIRLRYKPTQLGTIPNESDLKLAYRMTSGSYSWWNNSSFSTILDTIGNVLGINGMLDSTYFTGTTDIQSPLPVKLNMLRADRLGNDARITWSTASERNASRFEVERSFDRSRFEKAGSVRAQGNSSVVSRYQFTDENIGLRAQGKVVYYRLKMIDVDGRFDYSPVVSVNFNREATPGIVAYPNPFNDKVAIDLPITTGEVTISIVDPFGRDVASSNHTLNGTTSVVEIANGQLLKAGVYFVKVSCEGQEWVTRLVKQ